MQVRRDQGGLLGIQGQDGSGASFHPKPKNGRPVGQERESAEVLPPPSWEPAKPCHHSQCKQQGQIPGWGWGAGGREGRHGVPWPWAPRKLSAELAWACRSYRVKEEPQAQTVDATQEGSRWERPPNTS